MHSQAAQNTPLDTSVDGEVDYTPAELLLLLSQKMLQCAQAGEWERLSQLEATRLPLFEKIFTHGIADHVDLAREVLAIDEQTKGLALAEMPRIQSQLQKMKTAGKAQAAYQSIQNFPSDKS